MTNWPSPNHNAGAVRKPPDSLERDHVLWFGFPAFSLRLKFSRNFFRTIRGPTAAWTLRFLVFQHFPATHFLDSDHPNYPFHIQLKPAYSWF